MRVYEYAKLHSLASKDVIQFLKQSGFDVSSHMSVVPEGALQVLADKFERPLRPPPRKAEPRVEKKEEPVPLPAKKVMPELPLPKAEERKVPEKPAPIATMPIGQPETKGVPILEGVVVRSMSVADFADMAKKPVSEVILTLLRQGTVAGKNQIVTEKVVAQLVKHYGLKIREAEVKAHPFEGIRKEIQGHTEERLPVVVVIGHVDHGKTTLLDFIRKTRVAAKERGGITQHLGAYEVNTPQGSLVFLDTPGHGAFTKMRERGTRVADIAVLVVAADDGVMPQTIEAIRQAQAARIPLVVALNKIDKATHPQIEQVKNQLVQQSLVPEEWGGQTVCIPVSAKVGTGVDTLLEVLVLQSKLMELAAVLDVPARGYVLEAKKEKGLGAVATVICQHGVLKVGDYFISGDRTGKVTSLIDSSGKRVAEATPSQPIQVAGFDELPQAGDEFVVVSADDLKKAKQSSQGRVSPISIKPTAGPGVNLLVKVDNDSSREAVIDAVDKINQKAYTKLHIVAASIGNLSESDVQLANDTESMIYMLHTRADASALSLAGKYNVPINHFDIIYKLLEALEGMAALGKPVKMISKKIGEATILKVFDIKGLGVIAGAQVRAGKIVRDGKVIIWRGKYKVGEGTIKSLQREKKSIKEASIGLECAFMVDGFKDWLPDDRVECYQEIPEQ